MYVRLTDHFICRWRERVGYDKVNRIKKRLRNAIRKGPLFGQGNGTFIVQIGRGKYAIVSMDSLGWTGITLFTIYPTPQEGGMRHEQNAQVSGMR